MKEEEIYALLQRRIGEIAPEVDMDAIDPDGRFRDQFDFDSVDFLNLVKALEDELGIKIQERDYPGLVTLNSCTAYLKTATIA
jgi:acyl carrier protein